MSFMQVSIRGEKLGIKMRRSLKNFEVVYKGKRYIYGHLWCLEAFCDGVEANGGR